MSDTSSLGVMRESEVQNVIERGAVLVVTANAPPERMTSGWKGAWGVHAELGAEKLQLVTTRDPSKPKLFNTLAGLASFLANQGFEPVCIPFKQGSVARHSASPHLA